MRRFIITLAVAVTAVIAPSLAQAQDTTAIPEPQVIQTRIGTTPMFELNDGGGGAALPRRQPPVQRRRLGGVAA